jgi:hypothetical protein
VVLTEATWLSRYRFNARMVDRYRHGRVFPATPRTSTPRQAARA